VYTLIFAFYPAGKGLPYIIDACDIPGTEEILLHETNHIFYRAFAFRVGFIADPELQLLFCTEITECPGLDNFAIGFVGNEYSVLVNDKLFRASTKLAEGSIYGTAGFLGIVLVILRKNTYQTTVPQQKTYEVDINTRCHMLLPEVNQYLFTGWSIEYMVIDPPVIRLIFNDSATGEIMDVISQCLLIARKGNCRTILNEFLNENIVDRAYAVAAFIVVSYDFNDC
jgi:hypothetical protein